MGEGLLDAEEGGVAHEVELDAVDVEAVDQLEDDPQHVGADPGLGVVEAGADPPLEGAGRQLPVGVADQQLGMPAAQAAEVGGGLVDVVVLVHAHRREEAHPRLAAEPGDHGYRTSVVPGQIPQVVPLPALSLVEFPVAVPVAEALPDFGFVVVHLVAPDRPQEDADRRALVRGDHLLAHDLRGDGRSVRPHDPAVVVEQDEGRLRFGHLFVPLNAG